MKDIKNIYLKLTVLLGLIITITVSCEREFSEDVEFATYPTTAEVFTDDFVGMGSKFYFPYVDDGAKPDVFSVDDSEGYESDASIRIDVPDGDDPDGGWAGFSFVVDGSGRDLTQYDAFTFWAKSSQSVNISVIGFGEDKYLTQRNNVSFTTTWKKFIIPIPDPLKLTNEKGMFSISAGGIGDIQGEELGYTFWIDELKFEDLGTIAQPRPAILGGMDEVSTSFTGTTVELTGLTQTFNLASGENLTVSTAPSYFTFSSSEIEVARVSELGIVSIVGEGTSLITAQLGSEKATGSLTITSSGALPIAPIPDKDKANVKSIYSDVYDSVTESNFTPNFGGSTTSTTEVGSDGSYVQLYANNNYTGIMFNSTVDTSTLTYLHVDIYIQEAVATDIVVQIRDVGADKVIDSDDNGYPINDDKDYRFTASGLTPGEWTSFEIPLVGDIASQKDNLGALILVGGPDFILDNIYFY